MIGYIKGNLLHAEDGVAIVETGGVGFEINCSSAVYAELLKNGGGEVYTYTAVKEDDISLYGFISREEKKVFLQLISVNGVGPKLGMTVLSSMSAAEFKAKIASNDVKGLAAVKGLGKKTAERLVLELKDKMGADLTQASVIPSATEISEEDDDAVTALIGLGFSRAESLSAVKKAKLAGAVGLTQTISYALKSMR